MIVLRAPTSSSWDHGTFDAERRVQACSPLPFVEMPTPGLNRRQNWSGPLLYTWLPYMRRAILGQNIPWDFSRLAEADQAANIRTDGASRVKAPIDWSRNQFLRLACCVTYQKSACAGSANLALLSTVPLIVSLSNIREFRNSHESSSESRNLKRDEKIMA